MLNRHFMSLNVLSRNEILYVDILTFVSTLNILKKKKKKKDVEELSQKIFRGVTIKPTILKPLTKYLNYPACVVNA
jgi:hypothetical protein